MAGHFITFEGGEGSGKSTQVKQLAATLSGRGFDVVVTREPGGTMAGEALRDLLVTGDTAQWSALAEALLNNAARDVHLRDVIRPALARGAVVICDRFMDSTRAYQGFAGGCPVEVIALLEKAVVAAEQPDLTLVFDLDPAIGLARAKSRAGAGDDRYERKGMDYHNRLREAFLQIAQAEPLRCRVIDAAETPENISIAVLTAVEGLLHG